MSINAVTTSLLQTVNVQRSRRLGACDFPRINVSISSALAHPAATCSVPKMQPSGRDLQCSADEEQRACCSHRATVTENAQNNGHLPPTCTCTYLYTISLFKSSQKRRWRSVAMSTVLDRAHSQLHMCALTCGTVACTQLRLVVKHRT
jgi:hypothetical protein